jgi:hypothetical protein
MLETYAPHLEWFLLLAGVVLCWFVPRLGDRIILHFEESAARFAKRKGLAVIAVGVGAILARLAFLPLSPVPVPAVHDEFSYLLAGDTFAHGRLTNPPHPMWVYLDTFHVLPQPTYQSIYPPAQGGVLALGILLGNPWIGVLVSVAAMCAALTWMLQGWFPAHWAFLGGALAVLQFDLFHYWIDSYWGGAVALLGAALVMGALPRIVHHRRAGDSVALAIGVAILANSRPYEGLVFCLPVAVVMIAWLISRRGPTLRLALGRVIAPAACVLGLTLVFMGYYNWRVTGEISQFPHMLEQRRLGAVPPFVWQAKPPVPHYPNPQFENFAKWDLQNYASHASLETKILYVVAMLWLVYCGKALLLPWLTLPWLLLDHKMRLPLAQSVLCAAGLMTVNWFQPHYAAPMSAALFLLLIQGMRHLRRWVVGGRPVGVFLTRLVVVLALVRVGNAAWEKISDTSDRWNIDRARIAERLDALPGNHLIIAHYSADHRPQNEWVYNVADIDHARIVWAREIPGLSLEPLLDYYRGRQVWVVNADTQPPQLEPYRRGGS